MGTGKTGRYLNTRGSGRSASQFSVIHSSEGTFRKTQVRVNGKMVHRLRLVSGGHSEASIKLLEKYKISYKITKTYSNGVRIGNVDKHPSKAKREQSGQAWFPKSWSNKDIKKAGEHVASLKHNRNTSSGVVMYGTWKGVRVGVIKTNGKIATIFPDTNQPALLKKKRKK